MEGKNTPFDMRKWVKKQDALQTRFNDIQAAWMEKDVEQVYHSLFGCISEIISLTAEIGKIDELETDILQKIKEVKSPPSL